MPGANVLQVSRKRKMESKMETNDESEYEFVEGFDRLRLETNKEKPVVLDEDDYLFTTSKAYEKRESNFSEQDSLSGHLKKKRADRKVRKRHRCKLCDYSTGSYLKLKRHVLKHTNAENYFVCESCDKVFWKKCSLLRHQWSHADMKM
ncbi:uncharacterized protein LOC143452241 isoform X2 [Clavelina lepadiformis]|uniref:uncharacterized protein LOC143452241 isoform X2 n=1 Tax=Clavelina lepadiformis TaxID=159417 RepID=UPI0040438933